LACSSFPLTKTVCSPAATSEGSAITNSFIVFSAFTTFTRGSARWICSPSESVFETSRNGGMPWERSRGLGMSISTLAVEIRLTGRA
jgi:hypothetical protein